MTVDKCWDFGWGSFYVVGVFTGARVGYRPYVFYWIHLHQYEFSCSCELATAVHGRHGPSARVVVAMCNSAPFKTLDGIGKGGTRLYEEVMQVMFTKKKLEPISFGINDSVFALYKGLAVLCTSISRTPFAVSFVHVGAGQATVKSTGVFLRFAGRTSKHLYPMLSDLVAQSRKTGKIR